MTTSQLPAEADALTEAEHVARIKQKQDPGVSRAEGWRRRGPLLPALIFMIIVTQIPFLFTLYYSTLSWNLVRPGSRHFVGLQIGAADVELAGPARGVMDQPAAGFVAQGAALDTLHRHTSTRSIPPWLAAAT